MNIFFVKNIVDAIIRANMVCELKKSKEIQRMVLLMCLSDNKPGRRCAFPAFLEHIPRCMPALIASCKAGFE